MTIRAFAEKYNMSRDSIMSLRCTGYLPQRIFSIPKGEKITHIDESYYTRRWNFKKMVKYDNQELYYLITEHFSTKELSTEIYKSYGGSLCSYNMYFGTTLFSLVEQTTLKVTMLEWRVWRYFRSIERRLKRRGTSMKDILDNRMNYE